MMVLRKIIVFHKDFHLLYSLKIYNIILSGLDLQEVIVDWLIVILAPVGQRLEEHLGEKRRLEEEESLDLIHGNSI